MKVFEAKGIFKNNGEEHKYTNKVSAENEKLAIQKVFSTIGGKQKILRRNIQIIDIKEVKG